MEVLRSWRRSTPRGRRVGAALVALVLALGPAPANAALGDTVFLIMVDGAGYDPVSKLYRAGKLPHMRELVRAKGGRFLRTVTSFPSATAPALPELLVGRYVDLCQDDVISRVQDFDRRQGQITRYEFQRDAWNTSDVDLFDLVSRSGRRSFSYFEGAFRWASVNDFNSLAYRINYATAYTGMPGVYDRQVMDEALRDLRTERPPPALIFIGFGAVDVAGHARGSDHPDYDKALVETDRRIGRLVAALREIEHPKGGRAFDHSHFFIFGDHGMEPTRQHLDLGRELNRIGIAAADGSDVGTMLQASLRPGWHEGYDAVVLGVGSNVADLHFRRNGPDGRRRAWAERPSIAELRTMHLAKEGAQVDLVAFLLGQVGVEHVMLQEAPGRVQLFSAGGGEALIAAEAWPNRSRRYAYQVKRTDARGRDPLGYLQVARTKTLVTGAREARLQFHDEAAWLDASAQTDYPNGPPLLPKAFGRGPTAPDIIVTARPGFGFMPVVRGDHGSLRTGSAQSFMLAAGAELAIDGGEAKLVRLLDVNQEVRRILELPEDPRTDSRGLSRAR